jgi:lysophospholipase L1-like esterase
VVDSRSNTLPPPTAVDRGPRSDLSITKKLCFAVVATTALFITIETGIRVGAYFLYDRSPYFLFYGFRDLAAEDSAEGHNVPFRGYSKFQPNRQLHQYGMFAKPTPIRINSVGLRGADFELNKSPHRMRIICLGESSTFGFFDRDDFTYPALIETLARTGRHDVETINAGVPHANSDNILAMLKGELLRYHPDVVTLYAGFNDAVLMMDENKVQTTMRWLHSHVATYVALKRLVARLGGPLMYSRWSGYLTDVEADSVSRQISLHVDRYERNVREMVSLVRGNGGRFIFILQPITMDYDNPNSDWRRLTYAERVESARRALSAAHQISGKQTTMLVHSELMKTLKRLSQELNVPIVDNIAIMDRHPEYYASYVHITEDGNRALAEALIPLLQ